MALADSNSRSRVAFEPPLVPSLLLVTAIAACGTGAPAPDAGGSSALSLFERWSEVRLEQPTPPSEEGPRAELRFDGSGVPDVTWSVAQGVTELRVEDGRLTGRTVLSPSPIAGCH